MSSGSDRSTDPQTRPRVLFIAGTGRSGSTVIAQFLESVVDAVHVGELRYLWTRGAEDNQLCECSTPFPSCNFWSRVMGGACPNGIDESRERMRRLAPKLDRLRRIPANSAHIRQRSDSHALEEYASVLVPVYEQALKVANAAVVIDSSKDPSYLFALRATGQIDLEVVHLVRDSRAVAYSWTRTKVRPEVHWEQQVMRKISPRRSASTWMTNHLAVELYKQVDARVTRLRYEDFVADPERTIAHAVHRIGAPQRTTPRWDLKRHSFSGNPMRFESGALRIRPDDTWTRALSATDRRRVSLISAPLHARYGYPLW